jgi:hypothetical protein
VHYVLCAVQYVTVYDKSRYMQVEAMMALILADALMAHKAQCELFPVGALEGIYPQYIHTPTHTYTNAQM